MRLSLARFSLSTRSVKGWRFFLLSATVLGIISLLAAWQPFARNASVNDDLGKMQGRWETTSEGTKIVMTVASDQMSLMPVLDTGIVESLLARLSGGADEIQPEQGAFRLAPASSPKAIDLFGPNGKIRPGIYELDGPTLKICLWTGPPIARRPASFAASGKDYSTYVFRRSGR
jgi:uncharacterized protein (TIGR03067 family)